MLLDLPGKAGVKVTHRPDPYTTHRKLSRQVNAPPFKLSESVTSRSSVAVEMTSMMLTVAQAKGIRYRPSLWQNVSAWPRSFSSLSLFCIMKNKSIRYQLRIHEGTHLRYKQGTVIPLKSHIPAVWCRDRHIHWSLPAGEPSQSKSHIQTEGYNHTTERIYRRSFSLRYLISAAGYLDDQVDIWWRISDGEDGRSGQSGLVDMRCVRS